MARGSTIRTDHGKLEGSWQKDVDLAGQRHRLPLGGFLITRAEVDHLEHGAELLAAGLRRYKALYLLPPLSAATSWALLGLKQSGEGRHYSILGGYVIVVRRPREPRAPGIRRNPGWVEAAVAAGDGVPFKTFALFYSVDRDGFPTVEAYERATGRKAGEAQFTYDWVPGRGQHLEKGDLKGWNVEVDPEFRRQGLASAMYRFAGEKEGRKVVPGDFQTPAGAGFVGARRNPPRPPDPVHDTFVEKVGRAQRGAPERAMNRIQHAQISQLYGYLAEHIGDLTHRMADPNTWEYGGYGFVLEKVKRALAHLRHPYGHEREVLEQVENNRDYHLKEGRPERAEEITVEALKKLSQEYADEHRRIPVYNRVQRWARDAAVAYGEWRFKDAERDLENLEVMLGLRAKTGSTDADVERWTTEAHEVANGFDREGIPIPNRDTWSDQDWMKWDRIADEAYEKTVEERRRRDREHNARESKRRKDELDELLGRAKRLRGNPVYDSEDLRSWSRKDRHPKPASVLKDVMPVGGRIIAVSWMRNMVVDEEGNDHEALEELARAGGAIPRRSAPLRIVMQKRDQPLSDRIDRVEFHRPRPDPGRPYGRGWFSWEDALKDPETFQLVHEAVDLLEESGAVAPDAEWYWTHGGTFFSQNVSQHFRGLEGVRPGGEP